MHVPFLDLKQQYRQIRVEVMAAIEEVCNEQAFVLGPRVGDLERALARYLEVPHAVGVASGSDALVLSLMALEIGPGDEVITTPFTFFATAGAVSRVGARPVFVDIDPHTLMIDPPLMEAALTPRTRAIIPVHLFGQCARMEQITDIAGRHNVRIVEDACQAIGAMRQDVHAGRFGDTGCFSFFPSKNLGGFGDGGLITTGDVGIWDTLCALRVHGSLSDYEHERVGLNSRLDALQAAILLVKLPHLNKWAEQRRRNATRYERLFEEAELTEKVLLPTTDAGNYHVFNQFTVRVERRDELGRFLKARGVGTKVYYPVPLHLQKCYRELGYQAGSLPVAEQAARDVLSLPIYPELTDEQLDYVVDSIAAFYRQM